MAIVISAGSAAPASSSTTTLDDDIAAAGGASQLVIWSWRLPCVTVTGSIVVRVAIHVHEQQGRARRVVLRCRRRTCEMDLFRQVGIAE
ncbi:MAG: hypothetical protein ACRDFA_07380 [bacterium]